MRALSIDLLLVLVALTMTGCPEPICLNPTYSFAVTARFTPE